MNHRTGKIIRRSNIPRLYMLPS